MELAAQVDRTRSLVMRGLRVAVADAGRDAYRTAGAIPLDGEWLGAFAQPAVILRSVTAMSLTFGDRAGSSVDEYGEAKLQVVRSDGDRVEWVKQYAARAGAHPLRYVGRLHDGVLAGYWHALDKPGFCGVFWLARPERLSEASREALRSRVRSHSVPRAVAQTVFTSLVVAFGVGLVTRPVIALAAAAGIVAIVALGVARVTAMKREADGWKQLIG